MFHFATRERSSGGFFCVLVVYLSVQKMSAGNDRFQAAGLKFVALFVVVGRKKTGKSYLGLSGGQNQESSGKLLI